MMNALVLPFRNTTFGKAVPNVFSASVRHRLEGSHMNVEKYTDRAKGFIQSAQTLALREGHQQFTPEHLLKVLI